MIPSRNVIPANSKTKFRHMEISSFHQFKRDFLLART